MFTGIVEKTGKIKKIENKKGKIHFIIEAKNFLDKVKVGDSISCDGTCLTVVKKTKNDFTVELMPETLRVTKFVDSKKGDEINLEKSLKIGDRVDGHFVIGHVDAVGEIIKLVRDGQYTDLFIKIPKKIAKYLAHKGSASVNGVSLTIAQEKGDCFKVCLISHTLKITNLSNLKAGDKVNIEVDMLARYLEKLLRS
jgi:riboflavin synthase